MPFGPGYSATFSFGGTDISQYLKDVKFTPQRKQFDLPVLGGGTVRSIVGPVKTQIQLQGFIDPTVTALFTAHMSETTPTTAALSFHPQGGSSPARTGVGFVSQYDENTPSEGPGEWSATIDVDGLMTYG